MISDHEYNRFFWASRRGMLELDLILVPFVEQCLRTLDDADVQRYRNLLECEDTELFAWFLQRELPEDTELAGIVEKILTHAHTPRR
jgi:antitoxin CptB